MDNEKEILRAADALMQTLQSFRAERTPEHLLSLVRAAKAVEDCAFKPILLKHYRAVQVVNKRYITEPLQPAQREDEDGKDQMAPHSRKQ